MKGIGGGEEVQLRGWSFGGAEASTLVEDVTSLIRSSQLELRENNPFEEILQVDLVADKLLSFLRFDEMKSLSEVSWGMLRAIRKSSKFRDLARLHLSKEVLRIGLTNLTLEGNHIWKNVSLELYPSIFYDQELKDSLGRILKTTQSLNLYLGQGFQKETHSLLHNLGAVLKMTRGLKALGLEVGLLNSKTCPGFFTHPKIKGVLRGIVDLDIHGKRGVPSQAYYSINSPGDKWGSSLFHENIVKLATVVSQLKKFSFMQRLPNCFQQASDLDKCIPALMNGNRMSLEVIEIRHDVWTGMVGIHFPNLRSLKLSTDGEVMTPVENFLLGQPPLEKLDIFLTEYCNFGILEGLRKAGKLDKLRRLHLGTIRYAFAQADSLQRDWKFLGGMTLLKDFSLSVPSMNSRSWKGIGEGILRCLPPTTEKIALHCLRYFWKRERNAGVVISRFENLKELNLLECDNAMNNFALQNLIVHCPRLRALTFSNCNKVTDFGLTGIRFRKGRIEERGGASLDQLKGLTQLTIRDCPRITRKGLLSVMNFEHLKTFDYRGADKELSFKKQFLLGLLCRYPDYPLRDRKFLFRIARQNPSLEGLTISPVAFDCEYDRDTVKYLMRERCPRFKELNLEE